MANLTNKYIYETFPSLVGIGTSGTSGVTGTPQVLTDGKGVELPINVSTTEVEITGDTITQNLIIEGYGEVINSNGEWTGAGGGTGSSGTSGTSGKNGSSGTSGSSGVNGSSGATGSSGTSGTSGTSGLNGFSSSYTYEWSTSGTAAANKKIAVNNADYESATQMFISNSDVNGLNLAPFFTSLASNNSIYKTYIVVTNAPQSKTIQFRVSSIVVGATQSTFTGTMLTTDGTDFTNGEQIFAELQLVGNAGNDGTSGTNGTSGISGSSGTSGISGTDGSAGTSGTSGISGSSGTNGADGTSGTSGINGTNGADGTSGTSGLSGTDGSSGTSGISGTSGTSGANGISAGQIYYFNQSVNSDIAPYKELAPAPIAAPQQEVTTNLTGSQTGALVSEFLTPQLGFAIIPGGTQRFHLHFLKQASNDAIEAYVTIELADVNGTGYGTIIQSNKAVIGWVDGVNPTEVSVDITIPSTVINTTDRMIVKIYLDNGTSSAKTIKWYTEGAANYSYVLTSVGAIAGTSGTDGTSGTSGVNGTNGTDGTSGTSGTNGEPGSAGSSGTSGTSGVSPVGGITTSGPNTIAYVWSGSQAAYNALGTYDAQTLYFIE